MDPKTYGELKDLIEKTVRGDWPSRLNPSLTRSQALDILAAAIYPQPGDKLIPDTVRGDLLKRNVIRECLHRPNNPTTGEPTNDH